MEDLKIIKRAYELNLDEIVDGYSYNAEVVYAKNCKEAQQLINDRVMLSDYYVRCVGEMCKDTIPVRRSKKNDVVLFNDKECVRYDAEYKIKVNEENTKITKYLDDESITHCYIKKRGSYYGWDKCGYVSYKTHAGVYPKEEAVNYCMDDLGLTCVPINNSEHNELILNQIARLRKGLIDN